KQRSVGAWRGGRRPCRHRLPSGGGFIGRPLRGRRPTLVRDNLYFGRNTPGGMELSDSAWQQYVDEVLPPRFPAGLTIWDAAGQWRGASGKVERERSKVLTLLHS